MIVAGIIAEYNPFHNGHLYQIQKVKELLNPDYIIVALGNNFTQRGGCSLINKFDKAKLALELGVSLVIEIPTIFTVSSAESFASAGVKLLDSLGIVTHVCFGIEDESINGIYYVASLLSKENSKYKKLLKNELSTGISFPKARNNAIVKYFENNDNFEIKNVEQTLNGSNNILAIEYLKALFKTKSKMKPFAVRRIGPNENESSATSNYSSATNIRNTLVERNYSIETIKDFVPNETYRLLLENQKEKRLVYSIDVYSDIFNYILRTKASKELSYINGATEGNYISLINASKKLDKISLIIDEAKSKRFTYTALSRLVVCIILNITKKDFEIAKKAFPRYIRVLGFSEKNKVLLKQIQSSKSMKRVKLITNFNKFYKENTNKKIKKLLDDEMRYNNIYSLFSNQTPYQDLTKTIEKAK